MTANRIKRLVRVEAQLPPPPEAAPAWRVEVPWVLDEDTEREVLQAA